MTIHGFGRASFKDVLKNLMEYMEKDMPKNNVFFLISENEDGTFRGQMGTVTIPYSYGGLDINSLYAVHVYRGSTQTANKEGDK